MNLTQEQLEVRKEGGSSRENSRQKARAVTRWFLIFVIFIVCVGFGNDIFKDDETEADASIDAGPPVVEGPCPSAPAYVGGYDHPAPYSQGDLPYNTAKITLTSAGWSQWQRFPARAKDGKRLAVGLRYNIDAFGLCVAYRTLGGTRGTIYRAPGNRSTPKIPLAAAYSYMPERGVDEMRLGFQLR